MINDFNKSINLCAELYIPTSDLLANTPKTTTPVVVYKLVTTVDKKIFIIF